MMPFILLTRSANVGEHTILLAYACENIGHLWEKK